MSWKERGALNERATAEGLTPTELVRRTVEQCGSILRAAIQLEVSPNTIRYHLKRQQPEPAKQA